MAIVIYEILGSAQRCARQFRSISSPSNTVSRCRSLNNARQKHIIVLLLVKEVGPMATASVTVRVDEDTKRAAANIVEDFGFDLSSVTRAFYRQINA